MENINIQDVKQIHTKIISKKSTTRQINLKLFKDIDKILKTERGNKLIKYTGFSIKLTTNF